LFVLGSLPLQGFVGVVDVRDVTSAHLIALDRVEAKGQRLFCAQSVIPWARLVRSDDNFQRAGVVDVV